MSLFDISDVSVDEIVTYLDRADHYRDHVRTSELAESTVATVFYEVSTRTRLSFELAAARLGAEVVSFVPETSSVAKGEILKDTVQTVAAMGVDLLVVRHESAGSPEKVAEWTGLPVVNGGDGRRAHPTQTLLDLLTMRRHFGRLDGLSVGVVGDIENSRVARGLISTLPRMGAELTLVGPATFVPGLGAGGLSVTNQIDAVLSEFDVVYLLRVQKERGGSSGYPSDAEYHSRFGLTSKRESQMKGGAVVMHAGPMNRGVEISDPIADGDRSLILEQVSNGVPVRMAVMTGVLGAAQ